GYLAGIGRDKAPGRRRLGDAVRSQFVVTAREKQVSVLDQRPVQLVTAERRRRGQVAYRTIAAVVIPVPMAVDDVADPPRLDARTRQVWLDTGADCGAYSGIEQQRRSGTHQQVDAVDSVPKRRLDAVNAVRNFHAASPCFHYWHQPANLRPGRPLAPTSTAKTAPACGWAARCRSPRPSRALVT